MITPPFRAETEAICDPFAHLRFDIGTIVRSETLNFLGIMSFLVHPFFAESAVTSMMW
jgi:hypothetical protein